MGIIPTPVVDDAMEVVAGAVDGEDILRIEDAHVIPELVDVDGLVFIGSGSGESTSSIVDRRATRALVGPHLRGSEVTIRMAHEDRTSGC